MRDGTHGTEHVSRSEPRGSRREQSLFVRNSLDPDFSRATAVGHVRVSSQARVCAPPKLNHIPSLPQDSEHALPLFHPCRTLRTDVQGGVCAHGTYRERATAALLQVRETLVCPFSLDDNGAKPTRVNKPGASGARPWSDTLRNRNSKRLAARRRTNVE